MVFIGVFLVASLVFVSQKDILPAAMGALSGNIVQNPSFEKWENGQPQYWSTNGPVQKSDEFVDGKSSIFLTSGAGVMQTVAGLVAGGTYKLTINSKGGSGQASFQYGIKSGKQAKLVQIPAGGAWHETNFTVTLPQNFSGLKADFGLKLTSVEGLLVDEVSVVRQVTF